LMQVCFQMNSWEMYAHQKILNFWSMGHPTY